MVVIPLDNLFFFLLKIPAYLRMSKVTHHKNSTFNLTQFSIFFLRSLVAQWSRTHFAMQEARVQSLCGEDPSEKEMATHSVFLAGESQGQRSLAGYSPQGCKKSQTWISNSTCFLIQDSIGSLYFFNFLHFKTMFFNCQIFYSFCACK